MKYKLINKTLFFPEKGILVIGDLHLGYEYMLQKSGLEIPESQTEELIDEIKKILKDIKSKDFKIKKIIFLGDIKHSFGFEWKEKNFFKETIEFLKTHVKEKNIIFIKGNHDTIDFSYGKMKPYHIEENVIFIHGDKELKKLSDKKIKTIVMAHIHPSIVLEDKKTIKKEIYKCFLIGKHKQKQIIILPSFLSLVEGKPVNNYEDDYENYFSIIPKRALINFNVYVVGEKEIYEFGKIKDLF